MEKMLPGYSQGYTKAIQDIIRTFNATNNDFILKNKRLTPKLVREMLFCCLDEREKLRKDVDGFIRYNWKDKKFEWFDTGE